VTARILGGTGSLGVTYGATALAAAPQLLTVAKVVPTVQMFGVGAWALACAFVALRSAHGLNTNRTFWSTVVPYVVIALLIAMFAGLGALVFSLTAGSIVDGGLGS